MRKAIRTTIEENMLNAVKGIAESRNCNVNDVLEEIISMYIFWQEFKTPKSKCLDNSDNQLQNGISLRIELAIKEIVVDYGLSTENPELRNFINKFSEACSSAIYMANFENK